MSSSMPPAYQQPNQPEPSKTGGEPPLWAPWYGIGFVDAVKRPFKKYVDFTGRASHGEYWWFFLAYGVVVTVLTIIYYAVLAGSIASQVSSRTNADGTISSTGPDFTFPIGAVIPIILVSLIGLACLLPLLGLTWRRLHDAGYAGPFFFLGYIPIAGPIILIVLLATGSRPEGQRFDQPR